jgi:hypothetical protein
MFPHVPPHINAYQQLFKERRREILVGGEREGKREKSQLEVARFISIATVEHVA